MEPDVSGAKEQCMCLKRHMSKSSSTGKSLGQHPKLVSKPAQNRQSHGLAHLTPFETFLHQARAIHTRVAARPDNKKWEWPASTGALR